MQIPLTKTDIAVSTADVADNVDIVDVVGNKTDAAVGAVTTDKSIMGYVKGVLDDTGTTIPATITTLDALHDVPTADVATNTNMRDVVGNKSDTVAGTSLVSLAKLGYRRALKATDCTAASPITLFTVTGDVVLKVIGIVKTGLTTSDAITASVGVSGDTAKLIAQVADATGLAINEIWHDATPDATIEASSVWNEWIISNGQDIILTTTGTVTDGDITFYCFWYPLSDDGAVVAA